jgi:hypothetical protein
VTTSANLWAVGEGTLVDNQLIDLAIVVELDLIDRLKVLAEGRQHCPPGG